MAEPTRLGAFRSSPPLGRQGLLRVGVGLLLMGWVGTAVIQRAPTISPLGPIETAVGLWLVIRVTMRSAHLS